MRFFQEFSIKLVLGTYQQSKEKKQQEVQFSDWTKPCVSRACGLNVTCIEVAWLYSMTSRFVNMIKVHVPKLFKVLIYASKILESQNEQNEMHLHKLCMLGEVKMQLFF